MDDMTLDLIRKEWAKQKNASSCMPTCLFNMLDELSKRPKNVFQKKYSLGKIMSAIEYDVIMGSQWDDSLEKMRHLFKKDKVYHWAVKEQNDKTTSVKKMCEVLASDRNSYPMVSLGMEYLNSEYDVPLEGDPFTWPSHCVILLSCDEDNCILFDPYILSVEDPIHIVGRKDFEKYWFSADPSKGMAWFEMVRLPLEEFSEVKI